MCLVVSHATHPRKVEFQLSPVLGVLLYLCLHPLTQNDQSRHGNQYFFIQTTEGSFDHAEH